MLRRSGSASIQRWVRQVLSSSICTENTLECTAKSVMKSETGPALAVDRWRQFGWLSWSSRREISAESNPIIETNTVSTHMNHRDSLPYKLSVVTGDVRGAGSSAPALVTLFGEGTIPVFQMLMVDASNLTCSLTVICRWTK